MLMNYNGKAPALGEGVFTAPTASVVGDVRLGDDSSVWFGATVRGDAASVTIGARTNIQDNATIHCSMGQPTVLGDDVSVGHNAVVHSATLEDGVLIGMGAVVLDGALVGAGSTVGAGAVVTKGTVIPPNSLVLGVPGRVVGTVPPGANQENARVYVEKKNDYRKENAQ